MAGNEKLDQRWDASKQELVDAARTAGVDPDIMVKISGFESGFNSHAKPVSSNPDKNTITQFDGTKAISSAYGYGQFLNATWNDMIHKYGEKYGIEGADKMTVSQTNDPAIRDNPKLQAAMLAEFTRENVVKGAKLGGPDTDANVYAFHNLGGDDATKFLNAMRENPSQRVDQVLSAKVISGNPSLYGDGSKTLAESYSVMGQHMDRYEKYATEARTMAGQTPTPDNTPQQTPGATQKGDPNWPAPGNYTINKADKPREGEGEFGTPRGDHKHGGIDIVGKVGDPIESMRPGKVIAVKPNNGDAGNMITIDHGGGLTTTYMHLDKIKVQLGQDVTENTVIGTMGRSGNTPKQGDTHLHFETRENGVAVDPRKYLTFPGQTQNPNSQGSAMADGKLSSGDKGPEVERLQKQLNTLGYTDAADRKLGEDGKYGKNTKDAVEQFQRENGLNPTGVADAATLKMADRGMTRFAMKDDVLQPGERGPDVRSLQQSLIDAGFKGADGKPLGVDGVYGDNTKAAVGAYQKANGLPETGVADKATLVKMGEIIVVETREPKLPADPTKPADQTKSTDQTKPADQTKPTDPTKPADQPNQTDKPLISNPNHPDNKLYQQAVSNLEQLGPSGGFKSREELEKAAAAVAADAKATGLQSIDHVSKTSAPNGQNFLVAVQGDPTSPAAKNAYIDHGQAVNQGVDQSTKMAEAVKPAVQPTLQTQQTDQPQQESNKVVAGR